MDEPHPNAASRRMLPLSDPPRLALALALAGAAAGAPCAGFGPGLSTPVLGQPLDFAVQVRTDAGETLAPECIGAEVAVGERRLPAGLVRTALETLGPDSARIRVMASPPLDEPVVTVTVGAGCGSRVTRRYVLFVEPPVAPPVATQPAFAAALPEVPAANAGAGANGNANASAPAPAPAPAPVPTSAAAPIPAVATRAPVAATAAVVATGSGQAAGEAAAAPPRPRAAAADGVRSARRAAAAERKVAAARGEPPRRQRRAAGTAKAANTVKTAKPNPMPRLRLEAAEPVPSAEAQAVERALEAVAQAASAARAAASAASAADARIAMLERTVEQLRGEAKAQSELAAQLRERLQSADRTSRWLTPLFALVLALAALAMWLVWRLAALQKRREAEWQQAAAPARAGEGEATPSRQPTRPIPFVTSEIAAGKPAPRSGVNPAWPPPATDDDTQIAGAAVAATGSGEQLVQTDIELPEAAPAQRTLVLTPSVMDDSVASRDVSIEELIDLEQQAEFFIVLGQDDAAIDLLVEHLRNTGGGSPLPYLKLLEIYRRREDHEAYERMRARFNRRFNAYAPEWGADLAAGRKLDEYPGVVPRLQQVWARPIDAMAELEALLFRKSRGELFDLPAYREVLFLYSLARDLLDRESLDSGNVDLLLPMADGGDFGSTAPHPYLGLESDAMPLAGAEERATAPVDLDLTRGERSDRPTSIFDPLDEPGAPRPPKKP